MKNAVVVFGPSVDAALLALIDHVDVGDIPAIIIFLERIQDRSVGTLSAYPEAGNRFQGNVRMMVVEKHTFVYEYHAPQNEVYVLDMLAPGQNWR